MQPAEPSSPRPARRSRLAVPIAVGLLLFLGGPLVQSLPQAMDLDGDPQGYLEAYARASVASLVVRYGGALLFALCSVTLAFRLRARLVSRNPSGEVLVEPTRGRGPAVAVVVVGLLLLAAAEALTPLHLYLTNTGEAPGYFYVGPLGALRSFLEVSAFLGPLTTAAGTYLLARRLERVLRDYGHGPSRVRD